MQALRAEGGKGVRVKKSGRGLFWSPSLSCLPQTCDHRQDLCDSGPVHIHMSNKGIGLGNSYEALGTEVL